ncbi:hypothetical protein BFJ66_g12442 [Fusarium oxysporum f. sp. cepae]|nr:hypothetical protein BFJ66_g12442 [Fusarium oxysporum f. sp. cepae]
MRLVNTQTIQLEFLNDDDVPDYAILSHTWEQEEVLFHDMGRDTAKSKKGYAKLESCCRVARENGFEKEDGAYSLMGIFGINMPLLYGEGDKAFYRLQEEIMGVPDDHSLFAWKAIAARGG